MLCLVPPACRALSVKDSFQTCGEKAEITGDIVEQNA